MSEYIYRSHGEPLANERGEIHLARAGEIVRCRDCVYICNHEYANGLEFHTCSYFDSAHIEVEPDGFCAWGERRTNDN